MQKSVLLAISALFLLPGAARPAAGQSARRSPASGANAQATRQATAAFQAGSQAFAQGNLKQAQLFFERAVRLAPQVASAHTALGAVLRASWQLPAAEAELQAALKLDPRDRTGLLNLAIVDSLEHKDQEAVINLDRLRAVDPDLQGADSAVAAVPLAASLSHTGHLADAESLLQRAAAANPEDAAIADALGTIQAAAGHYDEAEAEFERSLALNVQSAPAHFHLGQVRLALDRPQDATAEFEKAHLLEPANSAYTLQLAHALDLAGSEAEVVKLLQTALQTAPAGPLATEMRYRLALALQSEGQSKQAIPFFTAVLADRPQDAEALINAGLAMVQTGDAPAGIALYRRALALAPATATLDENLGVAYLQQGNLNGALVQFRAGLTLAPENPQLHYDLGLALKLKDDLAGAVPEFLQAATLDPMLPDPPFTLGVIYMQQAKFEQAATMLAKATELRPDNGDAWATLGSVYRELGEPAKAEAALRRAINLLPDQPSPHINLASVLMAEGNKTEAIAERRKGAELTRIAVNRQKASFGIDSGALLLKQGKVADALAQYESAVAADPQFAAAHAGLATALERAGRKAEAAEERLKAAELSANAPVH